MAEKQKSHSPRCEWNFDWTFCDYGQLRAQVSRDTRSLVRAILTHSGVLLLFSFEALGIVLQKVEVDDWRMTNAGHAGARFVFTALLEVEVYVGARGREQL